MKKGIFSLCIIGLAFLGNAQTTAMDFNRNDCNGNPQHLFADLDAGNVVIIEYFMTNCGSCPIAGNKLEALKTDLLLEFPGKIKSYAIGYTNSYSCATVSNWVNSNGFSAIPMDSGALQVAYYGGMGMPTVVVLGGTDHAILGSPYIGLSTSDTTTISFDVHTFFAQQNNINEVNNSDLTIYPNPANSELNINLSNIKGKILSVTVKDLNGKSIYENNSISLSNFVIDTELYEAGMYIVEVVGESQTYTTKINIVH